MSKTPTALLEPRRTCEVAGLVYVSDDQPGYTRKGAGKGFYYLDETGRKLEDREQIQRIKSLAIPPAYKRVWICPLPNGHLQATGRDDRGRKQYRYHSDWMSRRNETKFRHLRDVGKALPEIRAQVQKDLAKPGYAKEKVVATVVQLMDRTGLRVGNEAYLKQNDSYGLTTLDTSQASVNGHKLRLRFRGKSGVAHDVSLKDRRIARVIGRFKDLHGQHLFQYKADDGEWHPVESHDVNAYLQRTGGDWLTSKAFRTWTGSVGALGALLKEEPEGSRTARKRQVVKVVKGIAAQLHNTPATCRKFYIHPALIEAFEADGRLRVAVAPVSEDSRYSPEEAAFLRFLEKVR